MREKGAIRTNVVLARWRGLCALCIALDTVAQSKLIVVFAENGSTFLLDSTDSALRSARGRDMDSRLQVLGTLEHVRIGREIYKMGSYSRYPRV